MVNSSALIMVWMMGAMGFAAPAVPPVATPVPASNILTKKLTLSPKKAAELSLSQGYASQEADLIYRQSRFNQLADLKKNGYLYDWNLTAETGVETDRSQTFSPTSLVDAKYERLKTTLGLQRSFITGTSLTFDLNRLSQKSDVPLSSNPSVTVVPEQTQDIYGVTLEQNLWKDFFGSAARSAVGVADLNYEVSGLSRLTSLQDNVLQSLRLFWEAYVAKENYQESLASRDRYEKLVTAVQRKSQVGYSAPGELAQIQAELETRNQTVQTTSLDFVKKSDALSSYLKLEPQLDLDFEIETRIPDPPAVSDVEIQNLRAYQVQEKKVQAAALNERLSESSTSPGLSFVGKAQVSGSDVNPGTSMSEATSGVYPKYYTGIKFSWAFGSGAANEEVRYKKASKIIEENKFERLRRDMRDQMEAARLKIKASHYNAVSSLKLRDLRQRVVQELTRTYSQGRTELKSLIDAINLLSIAEVQYIRAIGDYQIALSEWSAFTDQLVTQKETE